MNSKMHHQQGKIEDVIPRFETNDIKLFLKLGLLIRRIFWSPYLTILNLVEVELSELNLFAISGNQEFEILEE